MKVWGKRDELGAFLRYNNIDILSVFNMSFKFLVLIIY